VITKGFLRVTFSDELKIIMWEFEAKRHHEYLPTSLFKYPNSRVRRQSLNHINSLPEKSEPNGNREPPVTSNGGEISLDSLPKTQVNQFGLPPPVMRCFEITEVINYMKDLIAFAMERQLSPMVSLEKYHQEVSVPEIQRELQWTGYRSASSSSVSTLPVLSSCPPQQQDQDQNRWPQRLQRLKQDDPRFPTAGLQHTHAYPPQQHPIQSHYPHTLSPGHSHHQDDQNISQTHYHLSQHDDQFTQPLRSSLNNYQMSILSQDERPMTPSQQQDHAQHVMDDRQHKEHDEKSPRVQVKQEGEDKTEQRQIKEEKHSEEQQQEEHLMEVKQEHELFKEEKQQGTEKHQEKLEKQNGQDKMSNGGNGEKSEKEDDDDKMEDDDDDKDNQVEKEPKSEERKPARKRGRKPRAAAAPAAATRSKRKKTK